MAETILAPSHLAVFAFAKGCGFVTTPSPEDLTHALADLRPVLSDALVAGGLAVGYHGWERVTHDIDVLYAYLDGGILERLKPHFRLVAKSKSGWHKLEHRKTHVRLELIPEGALGAYGFIPAPQTVGGENGFISLHGLVWLKLVAGRAQDIGDLVNLAKAKPGDFAAVRERLPTELRERFDEVVLQARREVEGDPYRQPDAVGQAPARYAKRNTRRPRRKRVRRS